MSDYAKSLNFTALRGSTPADPAILDTEFALIATASATKMDKTGGTFSGPIVVPAGASGTQAMQASEVATADALKMDKAGGTFTGAIHVVAGGTTTQPRQASEITTEITNAVAPKLNISGGTLTGDLIAIAGAVTGETTAVLRAQDVKHYAFPSGTKMVFFQASAPTGWTQDTANNDAMLRVVSGTGGGTGGTHGASLGVPASTTGGHSLTSAENGPHTHIYDHSISNSYSGTVALGQIAGLGGAGGTTTSSGSGTAHTHTLVSWVPKTLAMIMCAKN